MENLVSRALSAGGSVHPLIIKDPYYKGIGFMNPSIFLDRDGDILVNLRHVNYTLYHSENNQKFVSHWGPLAYLHPESDISLRTINYLCRLDKNFNLHDYTIVDTSELDVEPKWEFIGLEDARLVRWDGDLYQIGVRRDTTTNGQGRMEYSKLSVDKADWKAKEESRVRISTPNNVDTYCEKNWMPVLDMPYHFIKWTNPTELVKADPETGNCETVLVSNSRFKLPDQRGGSQVIRWNNFYIAITHEVSLFSDYLGRKDGVYRHRLCVWDKEFNLIGVSQEPMSFMDARIEFACGMMKLDNELFISFGFQDNAAYVLRLTENLISELIVEAISNAN